VHTCTDHFWLENGLEWKEFLIPSDGEIKFEVKSCTWEAENSDIGRMQTEELKTKNGAGLIVFQTPEIAITFWKP